MGQPTKNSSQHQKKTLRNAKGRRPAHPKLIQHSILYRSLSAGYLTHFVRSGQVASVPFFESDTFGYDECRRYSLSSAKSGPVGHLQDCFLSAQTRNPLPLVKGFLWCHQYQQYRPESPVFIRLMKMGTAVGIAGF